MSEISIPAAHNDKISYAVQQGFSTDNWEPVQLLNGSISGALVYLIKVNGETYIAKIDCIIDKDFDAGRYYSSIKDAAELHLAPKVYFADTQKGVILMEYIISQELPPPSPESMQKFADILRELHHMPLFPEWRTIYQILDYFYLKLSDEYHHDEYIQLCIEQSKVLKEALSEPSDIKSCHCDLNPNNLLFDGKKLLLIDWQAASRQSFYFDLACCATFFYYFSDELCDNFLNIYFKREASETEKAKYYLMRIFVNIYYGIIFTSLPAQKKIFTPVLTKDEIDDLPTYLEFMQGIASGLIDLSNPGTQQKFGYTFLKTATDKINSSDFLKALEQVKYSVNERQT